MTVPPAQMHREFVVNIRHAVPLPIKRRPRIAVTGSRAGDDGESVCPGPIKAQSRREKQRLRPSVHRISRHPPRGSIVICAVSVP